MGIMTKFRSTAEWKDDDARVVTIDSPKDQGDEFAMMTITDKRRPSANP